MKILKMSNQDYELLKMALAHAECWMLHLANTNKDGVINEWASDTFKQYIELGFNIEVTGE